MGSELAPMRPLLSPQQALVDPRTGLMTRDWYLYFKSRDEHAREIERRLDALETGLASAGARLDAAEMDIASLETRLDAAELAIADADARLDAGGL